MIAKKLTKVGNTQAMVIDKTLLSLIDADNEIASITENTKTL